MARGKRPGQRRRRRGSRSRRRTSGNIVTIPFSCEVIENKTAAFSFNTLFELKKASQGLWLQAPWKMLSVSLTSARANDINEPSVLQVRINTAELPTNVESTASVRRLVVPGSVTRLSLRAPRPNPWKEDEQKDQNCLEIDNIQIGTESVPTKLICLGVCRFLIGSLPFNAPSAVSRQYKLLPLPRDRCSSSLGESASPYSVIE